MINFTTIIEELRLVMKPRERNRPSFVIRFIKRFRKISKSDC
jgi:hypothetical protein